MIRRPAPPANEPDLTQVLAQLTRHLVEVEEEHDLGPTLGQRARSWAHARRRSHGIPAAVIAAVFTAGQVIHFGEVPWWGVVVAGWIATMIAWTRAQGPHRIHTVACVGFAAAWLVLVAL